MWEPTHLDKPYWPQAGITKRDLIEYYKRNARTILPYLKNRPLSLKRYPEGVQGSSFFQKDIRGQKTPSFVTLASLRAKTVKKTVHYVLANNVQTLAWLANMGALELHPWNSRAKTPETPDYMVFDLDPGEKTTFDQVVAVAQSLHLLLDELKLPSFIKTSGKRGLHVYVPLRGGYSYEQVRAFARRCAEKLVGRLPALASLEVHPRDRRDKIYIDYLRNSQGQTAIAPYAPRATREATVSMPLQWKQIKRGLNPKKFTIKTVDKILKAKGDPWKLFNRKRGSLMRAQKLL